MSRYLHWNSNLHDKLVSQKKYTYPPNSKFQKSKKNRLKFVMLAVNQRFLIFPSDLYPQQAAGYLPTWE